MTIPKVAGTFCVAAGIEELRVIENVEPFKPQLQSRLFPELTISPKFLIAEKSQLLAPKPGCVLRARLPNCPRAGVE